MKKKIFWLMILIVSVSCFGEEFQIPASRYPEVVELLDFCRQEKIEVSLFGGTVRDIVLGESIPANDEYDILLPGEFDRQNLSVKQKSQLKKIAKILGGTKRCNFIFSKNKESFMRLMSIGGFSISKVAIRYDGKVVDPYGGFPDLVNRKLRYISGKSSYWPSFLKMYDILRAIRFVTQYPGMELEEKTRDYFYSQMDKLLRDQNLKSIISQALKAVKKKKDSDKGLSFDMIKAKVQVREIENRLRKAYQYSKDLNKTYELLDQFAITEFLKNVKWPEGGFVLSKLWTRYKPSSIGKTITYVPVEKTKPVITEDPYKTAANSNDYTYEEEQAENQVQYNEEQSEETSTETSSSEPASTEENSGESEQFEDFEFEFDAEQESGDFDFDFDFE